MIRRSLGDTETSRDDAQHARDAGHGRERADAGDQRQHHHHEIEHVPAIAQECPQAKPVRGDADGELGDEQGQHRGVGKREQRRIGGRERAGRLQPDDDGIGDDDDDDRGVESRTFRNSS